MILDEFGRPETSTLDGAIKQLMATATAEMTRTVIDAMFKPSAKILGPDGRCVWSENGLEGWGQVMRWGGAPLQENLLYKPREYGVSLRQE